MTTSNSIASAPFHTSRVMAIAGCLLLCAATGWLGTLMSANLLENAASAPEALRDKSFLFVGIVCATVFLLPPSLYLHRAEIGSLMGYLRGQEPWWNIHWMVLFAVFAACGAGMLSGAWLS